MPREPTSAKRVRRIRPQDTCDFFQPQLLRALQSAFEPEARTLLVLSSSTARSPICRSGGPGMPEPFNLGPHMNPCSNFLGLRPLAGYASLKLYHVMSCFCMRNIFRAMIWLVRLCMLPHQPQMMQGMPAFWAPAGPQPRRLTWGRARERARARGPRKSSPKRAALKPARKRATPQACRRNQYRMMMLMMMMMMMILIVCRGPIPPAVKLIQASFGRASSKASLMVVDAFSASPMHPAHRQLSPTLMTMMMMIISPATGDARDA